MSDNDVELGPVDYLMVEWPAGKEPTGEGLGMLVDLTERGLIRVIDLAFVRKDEDGTVSGLAIADLDKDGSLDLVQFEGASSGVLGEDEYEDAGAVLEPGASAAILVYENRWAAPFATALRRSGAELVASGRIPVNALIEKLDELEASEG
jgi:Family of unknown function (DUF6325)